VKLICYAIEVSSRFFNNFKPSFAGNIVYKWNVVVMLSINTKYDPQILPDSYLDMLRQ
jgi:hypothetical protein